MKNLLLPLAILISVITGCSNAKKEKPHNHGLEPLNQTIFTDKYEVYITSNPFVKGKENKLVVYITNLNKAYSPYSSTVNMIYEENGNAIQNEKLTTATNTFELSITPKEEGTGIITFQIDQEDISTNHFKVYKDEHAAEEVEHIDLSPTQVSYNKSQLWNIEFATQTIQLADFNEVTATAGEIKSAPGDEVIVSAKSSGIVIFGQTGMSIGKTIEKGSGMFIISNNDISVDNINTKFQQAKVNLDLAETNYKRNQDLIKDQIISQKELIDSKAMFENALIEYNTHAKNYSKGGVKVSSTISGFLKNLLVSEGQYVEVGTPLATIAQNKKLMIEADLTQKDFSKINQFKSATFRMVGSENVYHTDSLNGELISVGTSINPEHPFIPVSIAVDNVGDLISGAMVEIFLHTTITTKKITVPKSALLEEQGIYSVFTQVDGETFEKHEVKIGDTDGENYEIINGLEPDQRVVTKGVYQLKLAMASGSLPAHSHEH